MKMAQPEPRKEWNYAPELPIGNNPLFDWPLNVRAIFIYYRDSWLTLSEVSLFAILAIGGWWAHQAGLGGVGGLGCWILAGWNVGGLEWGWAIQVWLRNLFLLVLFAGGFHWLLHHRQIQGQSANMSAGSDIAAARAFPLAPSFMTICSGLWRVVCRSGQPMRLACSGRRRAALRR
jgi:hypothetical protein